MFNYPDVEVDKSCCQVSYFDWETFDKTVRTFVRMLDNVVELHGLALPEQAHEILYKRRHGMGYTGLGTTLNLLGMKYGSPEAIAFCEEVTKRLAVINLEENYKLGEEKGCAPIFEDDEIYWSWWNHPFTQKVNKEAGYISANRPRFTHATSIAPTGTISLAFGNNCSNGIEPSFSHSYFRNVIVPNKKTKKRVEVLSEEALLWKELNGDASYPEWFVTTQDITPDAHIAMQAAAQKWVDSSISKCVAEGTKIITSKGILPIEYLGEAVEEDTFAKPLEGLSVLSEDGAWHEVTAHYYAGKKTAIEVKLSNGQTICGSPIHRLKDHKGDWKQLQELNVGDIVLNYSPTVSYVGGLPLPESVKSTYHAKQMTIPEVMSSDLALWLGMWLADGSCNGNSVIFHNETLSNILLWEELSNKLFGYTGSMVNDRRNSVKSIAINSRELCRWLVNWVGKDAGSKVVPEQILNGSVAEWNAFLRGISLDGYKTNQNATFLYFGKSKQIADSIFYITTCLGYYPRLSEKTVEGYDYRVYGCSVQGFVGCLETKKDTVACERRYLVPLTKSIEDLKVTTSHPHYSAWRNLHQRQNKAVKPSTLIALGESPKENIEALKVTSVKVVEEHLYDIEVKDTHSYLVAGIISHNTINCPADISFEDFKDVYLKAYEAGLKGVTTYRPRGGFTAVLQTADHLETIYEFTLEDGTKVQAKASDTIWYDEEEHEVENLFCALNEGYYGKL